uniref:Uncharacterized protein n=1 Tax=Pseudonaja textilis TaxID=8673 RepID=A0A670ZCP5_PSETE
MGSSSPWGKERRLQRTEGYAPLGFHGLGRGRGLSPGLVFTVLAWWHPAHPPPPASGSLSCQASDLQLVREALRSLRNSFSGHDPQHHTIDSLEQGISSLMDRLHRMEVQKRQEKRVRGKSPAGHVGSEYRESWPSNSSECNSEVLVLRDTSGFERP